MTNIFVVIIRWLNIFLHSFLDRTIAWVFILSKLLLVSLYSPSFALLSHVYAFFHTSFKLEEKSLIFGVAFYMLVSFTLKLFSFSYALVLWDDVSIPFCNDESRVSSPSFVESFISWCDHFDFDINILCDSFSNCAWFLASLSFPWLFVVTLESTRSFLSYSSLVLEFSFVSLFMVYNSKSIICNIVF